MSNNLPYSDQWDCIITTTDVSILNAWKTATNRQIRIRSVWMDNADYFSDEINISAIYTNITRTFYKLKVEHNTSISYQGLLLSLNASINFSSNIDDVFNMSIYNFAQQKWDSSFCQNISASANQYYIASCNITENPQNYVSSGLVSIILETTMDEDRATMKEEYVQFYINSMKTNPPQIFLNLPENNARLTYQNINFNFTVIDDYNQEIQCYLNLDDTIVSSLNALNDTLQNFYVENINFGNHTWFVNCTDGEFYNSSEQRKFNVGTPPYVKIEYPYFNEFDENYIVPIVANITDPDEIKSSFVEIFLPNGTIDRQIFISTISSDSFSSDTLGIKWIKEIQNYNSRICLVDINNIYLGKAFTGISNNEPINNGLTGQLCTLISNSIAYGDFDVNISFNILEEYGNDYAINFQILEIPTSLKSSKIAFISLSKWTGYERSYEIYVNDGNTNGYISTRPTNDTFGKFRIKRTGDIFEFYTWNNTSQEWILESFANLEMSKNLYISFETESTYPGWGIINATWDDFYVNSKNFSVALFNNTELSGEYEAKIVAIDNFDAINDTERVNFIISFFNDPPTIPYILKPSTNEIISGIYNITWSNVYDEENDNLRFNISLLNFDYSLNKTIIKDYGNITTTYYEFDTTSVPEGNYSLKIDVYENETTERKNNSFTLSGIFIINKPPSVIINSPINETYCIGCIPISITTYDIHGIDKAIAEINRPDSSKEYINLDYGMKNDDFESEIKWDFEELVGENQTCFSSINNEFPGKAFISIKGEGNPLKDTFCSLISKKAVYGDFDLNVEFNITNYTGKDTALNLLLSPKNTSKEAPFSIFMSLSEWSGYGRNYEIYVNNMTFSGYISTRPTNDTFGKFRIKRTGDIFEFYTWNNTSQEWILENVSDNHFVFPKIVFIVLEVESTYPSWNEINVTFDNFNIERNDFMFNIYNSMLEGLYNITFFVNDTLGAINNTEKTNFTAKKINIPPTTPFILEPYPEMIIGNTFTIVWSNVFDANNDKLRYNITLLNPDYTFNTSIITDYGDKQTNYYIWNTYSVPEGNYSLKIDVYENETTERKNNSYIMPGYFIVDNTKPLIYFLHPTPLNNTIINKTLEINVSAYDRNFNYIDIFVYKEDGQMVYDNETTNSQEFFNISLPDGKYYFESIAYDKAVGVNSTEKIFIEIDNTLPQIEITSPKNITYNNRTIKVNISVFEKNNYKTFYKWNSSNFIEYKTEEYVNFDEGTIFFDVLSFDLAGNSNDTSLIFSIDTTPPNILFLSPSPKNNTFVNNNWIYINISSDAIDVKIEWQGINETMNYNGYWYINKTNLYDGQYHYRIFAKDENDNWFASDYYYFTIDTTKPKWYNNKTEPFSPIQYSPSRKYIFNISWLDENEISFTLIENNFTGLIQNYTLNKNDEYYYIIEDLKSAKYYWKFYANDTANNWNLTDTWFYLIEKNQTQIKLYINNSEENKTFPINSFVNISAYYGMNKEISVFANISGWTTQKSQNYVENITRLIQKGTFNITAYFEGDENYTSSSKTLYLTVVDDEKPKYNYLLQNASWIGVGHSILLAANWSDNYDLDYAWLSTNETGIWENKSFIDINLTEGQTWSNFTWSNNSIPAGRIIGWRIYANDTSGNVNATSVMTFAINASELWRFNTAGFIYSSPAIGDINGDNNIDVVFASYDKKVYALQGNNGQILFEFLTNHSIASSPSLSPVQGSSYLYIFIPSYDKNMYAINGSDGTKTWNFSTGGLIYSSPAVFDINNDGIPEIIFGSYDKNVYVLNSTNGEKIWNYSTGDRIASSPSVITFNGDVLIIIGSYDKKLYALNSTGDLIWQFSASDKIESSPAIGDINDDGIYEVVFGSYDNKTYVVNASNGELIWSYATGNWITSSPVIADIAGDKKVIIASHDSNVYSFNKDGTINWTFTIPTGGRIQSSPSIADVDLDGINDVIVGCSDSRLYALNGLTGKPIWSYKVNAYIFSSPALADINGDGNIDFIFGSFDKNLYSLDPPVWQIFGGNERRTRIYDDASPELIYFEINNETRQIISLWQERFSNLAFGIIKENSTGIEKEHIILLKGMKDWVNFSYYSSSFYYSIEVFDEYNNSRKVEGFIEGEKDIKPPLYFGNISAVEIYSPNKIYSFLLNWTDENNIEEILIEHNFTGITINQSVINNIFSISDLPADTYYWRSYAKDYAGNWNKTDQFYLKIEKAKRDAFLLLVNSTYPENITAICGGDEFYRNSTLVTNIDYSILDSGIWNYTCVKKEDQNYTISVSQDFLKVEKGLPELYLNINSTGRCPAKIILNAFEKNNGDKDVVYILKNDTHEFLGSNITLSYQIFPGKYNFSYLSSEGNNWTQHSLNKQIIINDNTKPIIADHRIKRINDTVIIEVNAKDKCSLVKRAILIENSLGFYRNHTIYGENKFNFAFPSQDLKDVKTCSWFGRLCLKFVNYKIFVFDDFDNENFVQGNFVYWFFR
ncbi:MAG: PQQ-binding-like beta-propeller repeat protein [Candidatus Aenigmarchaeota archaeon]|nr:PQQ-binding-like beta-propeller repeat protein [Candidatus Aenigmarchaeota archaeon]